MASFVSLPLFWLYSSGFFVWEHEMHDPQGLPAQSSLSHLLLPAFLLC